MKKDEIDSIAIEYNFTVDHDEMSLRTNESEGWIYYYNTGLTITPLGDIWFKRLDVEEFLRGFEQ